MSDSDDDPFFVDLSGTIEDSLDNASPQSSTRAGLLLADPFARIFMKPECVGEEETVTGQGAGPDNSVVETVAQTDFFEPLRTTALADPDAEDSAQRLDLERLVAWVVGHGGHAHPGLRWRTFPGAGLGGVLADTEDGAGAAAGTLLIKVRVGACEDT